MAVGGYDAFDDPYSYKDTNVLKNKLGLRDPELLEAFELEMTTLRANEPLPGGAFDARHYRQVHHFLFQDAYNWAGVYRTVRTSKGGNPFCFPEHIDSEMNKLFASLAGGPSFGAENSEQFVAATAHFLAELNAIHPFREGNGRAQLSFVHLLGQAAGYPFAFERIEPNTFLPAMIASYDGDLGALTFELARLRD